MKLPRSAAYLIALASALAMLALRESLAVEFDARPLLILFMFPIIVSALLGGLGPGLVATAVAALGVSYLAIPPVHSLRIAAGHDLLQWSFLIINGVAVSVLSEWLRRALDKAENDRRLLDSVIANTSDAVFVKDAQGRYQLANAAAADFVGKPPEAIVGHDDRQLFPETSARVVMAVDQAVMAGGRTQTHEEQLLTFDGRSLVFLVTKGPVFDAAGGVAGVFGIARDISERRRADDEQARVNALLEQRVTERTAELQSAKHELEELAYALTHNLRAPLRAIGGFSQLLTEHLAGQLDAEAADCLAQIARANSAMAGMLDGLLALLRCTRGELRREQIDVSALATRLLDEIAAAEPQRRVAREVAAGLEVFADAPMFALALRHLLDNAWKFSRSRDAALIRVGPGEIDGKAAVCIADNGAGFDMAHAGQLFQPFLRLHRQDEFAGIGIGLATVQRIIQRHGGKIVARAAPGAGASFCFFLPSAGLTAEEGNE